MQSEGVFVNSQSKCNSKESFWQKAKNALDKSGENRYNRNIKEGDRCVAAPEVIFNNCLWLQRKGSYFLFALLFSLIEIRESKK